MTENKPLLLKIRERLRAMQERNINRVYIPNGDFRRLEDDIAQFIKDLKEFIGGRTYIRSSEEGTSISLIKFMPFEFEDFLKEEVGVFEDGK